MNRVQVWASQLWANDFPPVCAMTGRPAETWRRFKFASPPDWAYALLVLICIGGLGFIAFAIAWTVLSQRASGYLPLTRASSKTVMLADWIPAGLLVVTAVLWIIALAVGLSGGDSGTGAMAGTLLVVSLLTIFAGLVGRLLVKPLVCPRAKVMEAAPGQNDRVVEIRNVSPVFVAAVRQRQHARSLQAPFLPTWK